jgi:hypothetical protein
MKARRKSCHTRRKKQAIGTKKANVHPGRVKIKAWKNKHGIWRLRHQTRKDLKAASLASFDRPGAQSEHKILALRQVMNIRA